MEISKSLTQGELVMIAFLADGYSIAEASGQLEISYVAGRQRLRRAYEKLDARNATDAVAKAIRLGLI